MPRILLGVFIGAFAAAIALANVTLVTNITEIWFRSGDIIWLPFIGEVDQQAVTVAGIFVGAEAGLGALFFVCFPALIDRMHSREDGLSMIVGVPVGALVVAAILAEAYLNYLQATAGLEGTGMFARQSGPAAFALGFFFASFEIIGSGVGLHLATVPLSQWLYHIVGSGIVGVIQRIVAALAFPSKTVLEALGAIRGVHDFNEPVDDLETTTARLEGQVDAVVTAHREGGS
jgi:hypothetical protein